MGDDEDEDEDDDAYGDEVERYNQSNSIAIQRNTGGPMSTESLYKRILPKKLLEDKEIQDILEVEEM